MSVRIRKSVWSLAPEDPVLTWYRAAVGRLLAQPAGKPNSWRYLGGIHGVPQGMQVPPGASQFWDQCQHQSWFFLPWHRGYLASFEAIVAKTIKDLDGPDDWALPYWDYSEDLGANPNARLMPPAFRNQRMPDNSPNPLWSRRAAAQNGDFGIDDDTVSLDALANSTFTSPGGSSPPGFGGPVTGFNTGGNFPNGGLESIPHNWIHGRIGGRNGFMSFTTHAALDPIFWLHHCNIDRLWEVWRNQGAAFANPTDPRWLSTVAFAMHDADENAISFTSQDMLDTTKVMHGYCYDSVPVAQEQPLAETMELAMTASDPELAGHSETGIDLEGAVTRTVVALHPEMTSMSFAESVKPSPKHVYLSLENITGVGAPGDYRVFIDLPDDDHEPALAGVMTTFGLDRASAPDGGHGGGGLSHVFEITALAGRLGLTGGKTSKLQVSFVREDHAASDDAMPPGLEDFAESLNVEPAIRVGRVSLFYD